MNKSIESIDALILCGGRGTRLQCVVSDRPKTLALIDEKPFLEILIDYLKSFGMQRIVLATGYRSQDIRDFVAGKHYPGEIIISEEESPLGTAGALKRAEPSLRSDPVLVVNGDSLCRTDLRALFACHRRKEAVVTMAVTKPESTSDFGAVLLDSNGRVTAFAEKARETAQGRVNAGIYLFNRKVLSMIPAGRNYSLEYDVFPHLPRLYGFEACEGFIDIGTAERYRKAQEILGKRK